MTVAWRLKFKKTRLEQLKQYFDQLTQTVDLQLRPEFVSLMELARGQEMY